MERRRRPSKRRKREPSVSEEPERSCVGCGRKAAPGALDRIARRPDGAIVAGRHEPGRGAWLCAGSVPCFDQAVKRRALERALRISVTFTDIEGLRARLYGAAPQGAPERPAPRVAEL